MSGNNEAPGKAKGDLESESEGELDFFELEVVSDKEVFACTFCNKVVESEDEVKKHLKQSHNKVLKFD